MRSTITGLLGKGDSKGDFNIFLKEGKIQVHDLEPKPKPLNPEEESKLHNSSISSHLTINLVIDLEMKKLQEELEQVLTSKKELHQELARKYSLVDSLNDDIQDAK